jgi:hypothetical protein
LWCDNRKESIEGLKSEIQHAEAVRKKNEIQHTAVARFELPMVKLYSYLLR